MTTKEVAAMIASIGLPYAYYQFPDNTGQEPPFLCFYYPQTQNFYADDEKYVGFETLIIELYTDEKAFDLEAKVETALQAHGLAYERAEEYIKSERMLMEVYTIQLLLEKTLPDSGET